jgi:hypothetical protein
MRPVFQSFSRIEILPPFLHDMSNALNSPLLGLSAIILSSDCTASTGIVSVPLLVTWNQPNFTLGSTFSRISHVTHSFRMYVFLGNAAVTFGS